jgi:hypothetical protein
VRWVADTQLQARTACPFHTGAEARSCARPEPNPGALNRNLPRPALRNPSSTPPPPTLERKPSHPLIGKTPTPSLQLYTTKQIQKTKIRKHTYTLSLKMKLKNYMTYIIKNYKHLQVRYVVSTPTPSHVTPSLPIASRKKCRKKRARFCTEQWGSGPFDPCRCSPDVGLRNPWTRQKEKQLRRERERLCSGRPVSMRALSVTTAMPSQHHWRRRHQKVLHTSTCVTMSCLLTKHLLQWPMTWTFAVPKKRDPSWFSLWSQTVLEEGR